MKGKQLNFFGDDDTEFTVKKRMTLNLPLDTLALSLVVLILLLTITFSLGVEKGRKIAKNNTINDNREVNSRVPQILLETDKTMTLVQENQPEKTIADAPIQQIITQPTADKEQTVWENETNKYIIQLASYVKEEIAKSEAKKLEKNGYPAFVSKKGKYIVIFVGEFANKNDAQKNMQSLKIKYKDCILRRL